MKNDAVASDDIDHVLIEWYEWSEGYRPVAGYKCADSTCRDFKISNQWMDYQDLSEQVDHHLLGMTGEIVEPIVMALNIQHRVAVMTQFETSLPALQCSQIRAAPRLRMRTMPRRKRQCAPLLLRAGWLSGCDWRARVKLGKSRGANELLRAGYSSSHAR